MAMSHKPFAAALQIKTWGQALARCRIERGLSHREVADRAGVSPALVRDWEMGIAYPARPALKRLHNMCFRQLQYFTGLLPDELRAAPKVRPADPDEAFVPEQAEGPPPAELAPPPEPKTFKDALKRAREEEGLSPTELADVLGVTARAIELWETGATKPYAKNYAKLLDLFPSLGSVPRPDGMRQGEPPGVVTAARLVPIAPASPPPPSAPVATSNRIADAGAAYALALSNSAQAKRDLSAARERLAAAEAALRAAEEACTEAHARLMGAVET